jgi:hypothetical protein
MVLPDVGWGDVSRFDDAVGHRQTSRTPGGDAGPESAANPGKYAALLGFAALTTSLLLVCDLLHRMYAHKLCA